MIEILVAIAILGILLAIAIPSYTDWQMERQLTSETRKVLGFVQEARTRAFTTKQSLQLQKNGNKICDGSGTCVRTEHPFTLNESALDISTRGVYEQGHIYIQDTSKIDEHDPQYSCVVLDRVRARLGVYDASTTPKCDAK